MDSRKGRKYSRLVEDPQKRRRFVDHAVEFLLRHGFDGLDLDWEFPGWEGEPGDKEGMYVDSYLCIYISLSFGYYDSFPLTIPSFFVFSLVMFMLVCIVSHCLLFSMAVCF